MTDSIRNPLVTIVVPTLRRPDYLRLSLASVVSQTYSPVEIIVSDNGSEDSTPQVVSEFAAPNLRFRQNQVTVDLYSHLNQCLSEAKGEYFVVISDDDLISSNFVEMLVRRLDACPEAAVGLTSCEIIDAAGKVIRNLGHPDWADYDGEEFILDWLWRRRTSHFSTLFSMFTRTDKVRQAGGFPVFQGNSNSDNAVFINLALQGKIVFVREAVFQYRVYRSSYGLSTPCPILAQSFSDFLDYIKCDLRLQMLLDRLPIWKADLIRRGVSYGAAHYYLGFLATRFVSGMSITELIKALRTYRPDSEYRKVLPLFPLYVAKQIWLQARRQ